MKRGAGLLAMFAFLMTSLRFASGPATIKGGGEVRAAEQRELAVRPPAKLSAACQAFDYPSAQNTAAAATEQNPSGTGEIATLVDRFLFGSVGESQLANGNLPQGIRLMIVTLPDPRHTHLSLQFDRTLEAIQQSAQDEHYTYDSSWLPWKSTNVEYSSMNDRKVEMKETAEREVCPGVLLFRRSMSVGVPQDCRDVAGAGPRTGDAPYQCGLLVFVVSENPTAGLNRVQWDNALHWIDRYASKSRKDKVLRILGPTFSGSLPSYVRALEETGMYAGTFTSTLLYSGRIRGCASWRWLKRELNPTAAPGTAAPTTVKLPVRLADFEENDALQSDRFYRYLKDRGHRLSEIAVLSEDETVYGGLPDSSARLSEPEGANAADAAARSAEREATASQGSCSPEYPQNDRPVHLYYPRDISAVRSAYQEQSIFSPGSKNEGGSTPRTVLRAESGPSDHSASDTVELFSNNNSALTQEAQLYGIVNTLKTHGIRYIVLRSTNSLDYLFLTRFLHRAYPTAYIVTMGSDLLFGREVDSTEYRGVVALSSFPLLPRGQDWTQQVANVPQHAHRVFGSYTMEGAYLASRFLITDPAVTIEESRSQVPFRHPGKPDIPDYALPFWERPLGTGDVSEPATWLAVVGRDGYWPLATLRQTLGNRTRFSNLALVKKEQIRSTPDEPKPQHLPLSGSWRFLCVLASILFGVHYFACRYGWDRQDLGMFVQFTRMQGRRGPALIATGWAAVCSLQLILFLTSARIYRLFDPMDKFWVIVMGVAAISSCLLALQELRWWSEPLRSNAKKSAKDSVLPAKDDQNSVDQERREDAQKARRLQRQCYPLLAALMFTAIVLFGVAAWLMLEFYQDSESGVTTAYRAVHLTSGVSPILSLIAMLAGFYWWFWQSLSGLALLADGRPTLPRQGAIPQRFWRVSDQSARTIEQSALPFPQFGKSTLLLYLLPLFLVLLLAFVLQRAWTQAFDLVLHSLENTAFNRTLHVLIGIALYLILLECIQLFSTWQVLKRLLMALDRLPLRRTFAALQGLSMRSLWRLSGTSSRARYRIFSHQMDSLLHLRNELDSPSWLDSGTVALRRCIKSTSEAGSAFIEKRSDGKDFAMLNNEDAKAIRQSFCACAETILNELLIPAWQGERGTLDVHVTTGDEQGREQITLSEKMTVRLGEEFLCMIYVGYLQNLLGCMRTMVLSIVGIFAAIALAVGFYPYTPRPTISLSLLCLLLIIGAVVGSVFAGLDRDSTLSHITNTQPGSLGAHFWVRMISFVGVPALGLIVAQFPEITDFVFSWIQPTMSAMK